MSTATRCVFLLALLLAAGAGHGALTSIEESFELAPAAITLPVSVPGQAVVRPCRECEPLLLRLDAATRYLLQPGGMPLSLAEFTRNTANAAARPAAAVFVYYDPQTRNVRRLVLNPGR